VERLPAKPDTERSEPTARNHYPPPFSEEEAAKPPRGSMLTRSHTSPTTSSSGCLEATPRTSTLVAIANAGSSRHSDRSSLLLGTASSPGELTESQRESQMGRPRYTSMNSERRHFFSKRRDVVVLGPDPGPTYNQVARTSMKSDIVAPFFRQDLSPL
jgi:hypothetical protein